LKIESIIEVEDLIADITKAVPIGLIVNEAITNSLKHAFGKHPEGPCQIGISAVKQFDQVKIRIYDNGSGFPKDGKRNDRSLGLSLIESLAEQIDGKVIFSTDGGAVITLTFPI
jgi:two-component sensor histidine kinase